jgi:hypothetical protein
VAQFKQLQLELREVGYEGAYDRMAAFARQWKVVRSEWGTHWPATVNSTNFCLALLCDLFHYLAIVLAQQA